ncbi:MAG: AAA family ATPase [Deltaproteobacteria bacterium]|nr:AAA family ATPase [Deltaproteobacteria bacterium]
MSLTEQDAQAIGDEEEQRWKKTHLVILNEVQRTKSDFQKDRELARNLTSQIVASRRDEDKAALASDEAVAHGLANLRKDKSSDLESLVDQPYFARVITDEDGKNIEFKLGTASLPSERIIDWRKGPISKLYYDYREGDLFSETIQGQDREGYIKLRRSYEGKEDQLHLIETAQGAITRTAEGWKIQSLNSTSRKESHDGHLPPILSLITAEQYRLITSHPQKPMVIQGIAGSGKTTVALHRLAWLLHENNSSAQPEKCLVVMFNRSLKAYVETTLPELKIKSVPIRTFSQWSNDLLNDLIGPRPRGSFEKGRELELFKSSSLCLKHLYDFVEKNPHQAQKSFVTELFEFYQDLIQQDLLWRRWQIIQSQLKEQIEKQVCELQDDPLLLHLIYAEHGYYPAKNPSSLGLCDHIVIDEAQDFGSVEVRALLNALDLERTVTIVGDVAQKIVGGRDFGGWNELLKDAGFVDTLPIALTVSYRSTQEIMEIAEKVRGEKFSQNENSSSGRRGPSPLFKKANAKSTLTDLISEWIEARQKDSTKSLSAIICRWPKQAVQLLEELRKRGYTGVRLGHREQFDFSPGITITNVHQVKGLEFRNVLIVEASEENYKSSSEEETNLLYVAVTRAEERLDFVGNQDLSRLLPGLSSK